VGARERPSQEALRAKDAQDDPRRDDSVTIRKVVELTFHDTDIRVESTGNGREALLRIAATKPDLVLADVIMPEPSGYEICRAVKSSDHPVPVLLLAGAFEPFDPERAKECGADGHVVKPFESRSLLERALALLESLARAPRPRLPRARRQRSGIAARRAGGR